MCYTVMCSLVSDNSKVRTHQGDHTSLARLRKLVLRCTLDMISVRSSASEQSSSSSRNICCLPNMKDSCLRTTLGEQRETMRHLPWSRNHTTPWSRNHTTPWSRNHTTPWSKNRPTPWTRNHTIHGPGTVPPHGPGIVPPHGPGSKLPHGPGIVPPRGPVTKPPHGPGIKTPDEPNQPMDTQTCFDTDGRSF